MHDGTSVLPLVANLCMTIFLFFLSPLCMTVFLFFLSPLTYVWQYSMDIHLSLSLSIPPASSSSWLSFSHCCYRRSNNPHCHGYPSLLVIVETLFLLVMHILLSVSSLTISSSLSWLSFSPCRRQCPPPSHHGYPFILVIVGASSLSFSLVVFDTLLLRDMDKILVSNININQF